ncbi:MAG: DEAD/DEAH box helicase [Flammeovirgaceae bacterium]|nr:DEAD/DEAH box helicase [Flammeovirgaceae bacterium]
MFEENIFQPFKKTNTGNYKKKSSGKEVCFCLKFDEFGAYIDVTDKKTKPIDVNYLSFSGATRNVLRSIEEINDKNIFQIDWEKTPENIYLADHSYLLWQLKHCHNIIDNSGNPLSFQEGIGEIQVQVQEGSEEKPKSYEGKVGLEFQHEFFTDFQLLTDEFVTADSQIIEIKPIGNNFLQLHYFNATFQEPDFVKYLSLLFSFIENCKVIYKDFKVNYSGEKIYPEPALIFEKIDEDDALVMRVGQTLSAIDFEFLEQYELLNFAEINQLEKTIYVRMIEQSPLEDLIADINKALARNIPKKKGRQLNNVITEGNMFIVPKEIASEFIYRELPELLPRFKVFGAEKLKSYKISTHAPTLHLNLSHGIDFLEGEVSLDFNGEKIGLFDVINQFNKKHYISLGDGSHALVNEQYIEKLNRLFKKKKEKAAISFFDLPIVEELIDENASKATFQKSREIFKGFNTLQKARKVSSKVNAKLRPYQEQGIKWLKYLEKNQLGGCLADDMGLGKTLQTLGLLSTIYPEEKKPSLIVMPKSLLYNWANEVGKFCPQISHYIFHSGASNLEGAIKANLIFTTYGMLRNNIQDFSEEAFHYVILDESQNIKNINTQTSKAVLMLNATHRLALSGTPVENNLNELFSLFRFLLPSMFSSAEMFNRHYATPIQKNNDVAVMTELRKKIYPFILRRLKKDVLKDLPDKIEQVLYVEMTPKQKLLYEQRRQYYKEAINGQIATKGVGNSQFFIFQALNELRQIASIPENKTEGKVSSPKLELLLEQMLDAISNGHKILIFVNYLNAIELIGEKLNEAGIDFVSMSGSTRNRQEVVERFQTNQDCKAFIMTLKTGGTGLNLTAADTVFIFDPWWNVAAENQAIDRAHRIGQENKVLSYKLITKDSIEEKILLLQEKKKEMFENIISADSTSVKSLSEEDINYILGSK